MKKFDSKLVTMIMAIMVGMLTLVVGIVFYTTFEPPLMTVVLPELEAYKSWTAVAMVLGIVFIVIAVVNYFAQKKKWWDIALIATLVLAIVLEIVLVVLLFKNTNYIENSSVLLVLSFFVIGLYIATLGTLSIQNCIRYTKNKYNKGENHL